MRYASYSNDQNPLIILVLMGSTIDLVNETKMFLFDNKEVKQDRQGFILAHFLTKIKYAFYLKK